MGVSEKKWGLTSKVLLSGIEVSDKVILYAWDNKLYPATSKIDWVLFYQRVDEEATRVCIVFVVLALFVAIWGPKLVL